MGRAARLARGYSLALVVNDLARQRPQERRPDFKILELARDHLFPRRLSPDIAGAGCRT